MANYTVAVKLGMRTKAVTIEAEDALVAALKIKLENPEALLTYGKYDAAEHDLDLARLVQSGKVRFDP
jgi:hypothetical protein